MPVRFCPSSRDVFTIVLHRNTAAVCFKESSPALFNRILSSGANICEKITGSTGCRIGREFW